MCFIVRGHMVHRYCLFSRVKWLSDETSKRWAQAVGNAVRARRRELDLSQERLAYAAKLDRAYLSGVERGRKNPTIQSIRKISGALQCRPSELLARAEDLLSSG